MDRLTAVLILILAAGSVASAKSGSVLVTAEMRAAGIRNCERFEWAANFRDALIAQLEPWMALSDEELWALLPSQEMPRDAGVMRGDEGCPNCGAEHYQAPYSPSRWHVDLLGRPWQVQCRNCQEWFPRNDFAAYYRSALDEQGKFRLGRGDPRFLQAAPGEPADWTDDGTGMVIGENKWFFAAYYAFRVWQQLLDVTEKTAIVYTLTGDLTYAHKAGVLLDRMADLYPEMDYLPSFRLGMEASTGGSGRGRVQGKIWETWTAQMCSLAYDQIYDALLQDQELVAFSARMAERYGTGDKSSGAAIARHIEDHLLREFIAGVRDGRIEGNPGMHHLAMACAAVALDDPVESPAALDWLFAEDGGAIPYIMHERLNRNGLSDESALGYARIPALSFYQVAELLHRYPAYTAHDILHDYPKFRAAYTLGAAVRMLDSYSPNWGDGDKCMNFGRTGLTIDLDMALQGFRIFGTPAIAREVWFANGKTLDNLFAIRPSDTQSPEGIHRQLYEEDPEAVRADLERMVADVEAGPLPSYNSGGYGQAVLQAPYRDEGRALAMYYGRMTGHGHNDRLNYILVARNVVMTPDMGYPLFCNSTWRPRFAWDSHIISHNTCMINDTNPDTPTFSGKTRLFAEAGPVRVTEVDGGPIYTGVSTYRRCMVMVDVDEAHSYVLDLFQVRGGRNHRLIQNGGGPEATVEGVSLIAQPTGTYAGPDVEFGAEYDGPQTSRYRGSGFSYLERVEKSGPAGAFTADWRIIEPRRTMPEGWEAHLRAHNLTPVDEVALATGHPPAYKGNPESLRYLLRTRFGEDLTTQFVTVLEPYGAQPFIAGVRLLESVADAETFAAAVEVMLADGRRDVLLVREEPGELSAGGSSLSGRLGFARFEGDAVVTRALIAGERLEAGGAALTLPTGALTGTLVSFDDRDPADVRLRLDGPELTEDVVGRYIIFANTERSDASYRIERVVDAHTVSIGDCSLIERLVDRGDYARGVVYNIAPGDAWAIALSAHVG